jgi:hypothetical protein
MSHPCASSWSIVSGVSAAAKLDAASIVAKNRPERMHDPKADGGFFHATPLKSVSQVMVCASNPRVQGQHQKAESLQGELLNAISYRAARWVDRGRARPLRPKDKEMKNLTLMTALLLASSPVAAQSQQHALGAGGMINNSLLPNTGIICQEEMTATFCKVPTSPNLGAFGSSRGSTSSAGSGSGTSPGAGTNTSSISPCGSFPPTNELCN